MREHQITVPTDPRIAEGYSSARTLGRTILAVLSLALIGTLLGVVVFATAARAAGSDSPTPYTVDKTGITLPAGQTFPAHGHVNVRWTNPDGAAGVHFDPNNGQPGGVWIGQPSIPWTAFGVPAGACVAWVQVSTFNEHFGEGGPPPMCLTEEEPWTPEPQPTETPTTTPAPSPTPSPTSVPTSPVLPSPTVAPSPGPSGAAPATPDAVTYRSEVLAVDDPADELAATGANAWVIGGAAAAALILGTYLVVLRRRRGERCPECGGPLVPVSRTHWAVGDWDGVSCRDCWWTEAR